MLEEPLDADETFFNNCTIKAGVAECELGRKGSSTTTIAATVTQSAAFRDVQVRSAVDVPLLCFHCPWTTTYAYSLLSLDATRRATTT